MPFSTGSHATPAEIVIASWAYHARTPSVFFNPHTAFWTSAHIVCKCETPEGLFLLLIAKSALMPGLLTLEAGKLAAVVALKFKRFFDSLNLLLALEVWAKYHIRVRVDLSR